MRWFKQPWSPFTPWERATGFFVYMEVTKSKSKIEVRFTIELSENEARAFNDFAYHGAYQQVLEFIQKGWANKVNKAHLKELFDTVHNELGTQIKKVDAARKMLEL